MNFYLTLPLVFLKFWFFEALKSMIVFFASFNTAFLDLFSLPILAKTFFRPLKNEYREGLVGFSIGMGIFVKMILILVDFALLMILLLIEGVVIFSFIAWPILTVILYLKR